MCERIEDLISIILMNDENSNLKGRLLKIEEVYTYTYISKAQLFLNPAVIINEHLNLIKYIYHYFIPGFHGEVRSFP